MKNSDHEQICQPNIFNVHVNYFGGKGVSEDGFCPLFRATVPSQAFYTWHGCVHWKRLKSEFLSLSTHIWAQNKHESQQRLSDSLNEIRRGPDKTAAPGIKLVARFHFCSPATAPLPPHPLHTLFHVHKTHGKQTGRQMTATVWWSKRENVWVQMS